MGNKLCKKKSDTIDNPKSPTPFDRIITRLHLRPNSWKSDSHLNQKQVNRSKITPNERKENIINSKPLSKSSDWTDMNLEVPDKDEAIHLRNPKLSLIFDNNMVAPTPPPRKHKKGLREKIEAVAKNGLQALQAKKPVEEPLCVKKTVTATCPIGPHDCGIHRTGHKNETRKELTESEKNARLKSLEEEITGTKKETKRRKNLSVISLPNYNELKLTVAHFDDDLDKKSNSHRNSLVCLPNEGKKSNGKLETCMTRCRSFGSLLPQQLLNRLKVHKKPIDIGSDDSFGALEDWDLRIIEHYNPKDTSLPRPSKPPNRRERNEISNEPEVKTVKVDSQSAMAPVEKLPTRENGKVEHSSLLKVLEEFSIREKQQEIDNKRSEALQKDINSIQDFLANEKFSHSKTQIVEVKAAAINNSY